MRRVVQPFTPAEERELDRLVAGGMNAIAARQRVAENRFRGSPASAAIKQRDGGDCHLPGAHHDQASQGSSVLHGDNHGAEPCETTHRRAIRQ